MGRRVDGPGEVAFSREAGRRLESGLSDNGSNFLLSKVVRTKSAVLGFRDAGRKEEMASVRSPIVEVDRSGIERVGGNERPGKVERRTLTV